MSNAVAIQPRPTASPAKSPNAPLSSNCQTAPVIELPVDGQRIRSVLYPGQVRGGNFKPHGGLLLNGSNDATVTLPLDAKVIDGVRYNESGELQYMFDFEAACGYRFRLDHLHTLSADFQKIADKLPTASEDSRTTNLTSEVFKQGTVVATKVGFVKTGNTGFDFGLYDTSKQNEASKQADWPRDFQYQTDSATHAVCWFDYLSTNDSSLIRGLPAGDMLQGKNSVFCNK